LKISAHKKDAATKLWLRPFHGRDFDLLRSKDCCTLTHTLPGMMPGCPPTETIHALIGWYTVALPFSWSVRLLCRASSVLLLWWSDNLFGHTGQKITLMISASPAISFS
jgi:hypothetical protein